MVQTPVLAETPPARLAAALELLGELYGVPPPDPEDPDAVLIFLAEAVAALALDRRTMSATRQPRRA